MGAINHLGHSVNIDSPYCLFEQQEHAYDERIPHDKNQLA